MPENRDFIVRPLSKQVRNDNRDAFRVYLSSTSLAALKLKAGDVCRILLPGGGSKDAIAWNSLESIGKSIVQTSRTLQDCYGIKIGEQISLVRVEESLQEIGSISLTDCSDPDKIEKYGPIPIPDRQHWAWSLEFSLSKCEALAVGLTFDLEARGEKRSFRVATIRPVVQDNGSTLFRFGGNSKVLIDEAHSDVDESLSSRLEVLSIGLGGMSRQIQAINETLADFHPDSDILAMPSFYEHSRGILLYGPKGTGKSALLSQIRAAAWRRTFDIGSSAFSKGIGDGATKLRNIFQEAVRYQPSVVIIDQLEFIAPKKASADSHPLAPTLCECMDLVRSARVLVVGATRHPNDVDDVLRTPHRFADEIELQIPTARDRAEILHAICGSPSVALDEKLVEILAEKTHGYVGADLFALLQLVCRKARRRQINSPGFRDLSPQYETPSGLHGQQLLKEPTVELKIEESDVLLALQETRPTAMREVFLETPKVRWTDIGGQHDIKRRLQKAVERPLKFPERMNRLNVKSKKGILLYGPPGCSKTLTVKALATEAGLNFMAVKGAEILSMYVGESERALREIFRKARSARPSIIFFDEIDAIAAKRGNTSQGGVNVLTTLLNEMDGIEELRGVLVVAATNKPDVLDPALMRPGRLDNILYIGPPDFEARTEILHIWFSKSVVDPEVGLEELALKTEGYTGAEIVSICQTAGDSALDEEDETGHEQTVCWRHFKHALRQVRKQVDENMVREYEQWRDSVDIK
ncbi:P-loop containing nucleoside triphosphate hydrolase protein [Aspergillus pseudoustus]|uniref:P-loop containing nucleoside triphosphate hydrolase protein n=1 Tax=Aspergillus pseudoustus TaxID=1810923 RepID=A0ABR4J7N0_9EURO